eukprot:5372201-Pleurochrysis_carterae.AAC.1
MICTAAPDTTPVTGRATEGRIFLRENILPTYGRSAGNVTAHSLSRAHGVSDVWLALDLLLFAYHPQGGGLDVSSGVRADFQWRVPRIEAT